jgi:hypothetical protein
MPNKTVHCKLCGASISGSTFKERMAKIRRHYKNKHPKAWAGVVKKAVATKVRKKKAKKNPELAILNPSLIKRIGEKAKKLFTDFHEFGPTKVIKLKVRNRMIPKVVVILGQLPDIAYLSDKWNKGKRVGYVHKFKTKPYLCVSEGGDQLYIIGGNYRVKPEGIVG